ncbi:unnamed protein product [Spirodela intermedia]|uniref:Carboxypeptidase n=1 Tax=Spirodela intermedia TaxID=51605 RepID=A0A7I8JGT3_SPIIN|nr:unnamed protein product [Spirodela intermedia]CAA6669367.1 unnamed protein product [Spirodela intermedia]
MGSRSPPAVRFFLIYLSLFFSLSSSSANSRFRDGFASSSRRLAVDLIRGLNLLPDAGEVETEVEADTGGPRLVEKKLNLEILGVSGSNNSIEDLGHHAGYYRLEHTHAARMFYFFFESRGRRDDPVVLWLTGGPGCSSELALFYENGPFSIADNMSLIWNDYGWDKASNIIFVDQPTGTGFSYSTDVRDLRYNEKGVGDDIFDFLQAFFEAHPGYSKNEFYVTGESYAGHYIPAVAERIHRGNKENQRLHINLKGFAIGNGLTNPGIQYRAYPDYALEMGIIKQDEYNRINKIVPVCELATKFCGSSGALGCLASLFICNSIFNAILLTAGDINYYDVRKKCEGNLCYDFSNMDKFLNLKPVRGALGVGERKFVSCSPVVYEAMLTDWMKNLEVGIPALIEDNIKLLVYAGEYDLICNWLGNYRWVDSMEWSGQPAFAEARNVSFNVDGKEAGRMKTYGSLTFLKVHDAGHMVPMDQPKAALEMLKRWMKGTLLEGDGEPAAAAM